MTSVADRLALAALYRFDAESAHHAALWALERGLAGRRARPDDAVLATHAFGLSFPNPVGMAAGFDKDARVMDAMLWLGFGFVEAGTVTPKPQPGNPKPRLFRLTEDRAVINRFGFNSEGLAPFVQRLKKRGRGRGIVGANVGKNKETVDGAADYVIGIQAVAQFADYLVVNISSPNTPGLRALQAKKPIEDLLTRVIAARDAAAGARRPALLAKVGPDLSREEMRDIADVAFSTRVDGLIIGNTTVARPPSLKSPQAREAGGLSGKPLLGTSTACLSEMYRLTEGRIPLIGCGGIASGADAYAKIRAGATLVQIYSALVFEGPGLAESVKRELAECLHKDGFASVAEAVGADHAAPAKRREHG